MASMIFASSPLSVQSFVKLRTNSNYSHSPCYVSRAKNSYTYLPYNNISNIQSSKSLFTKGDGNFSFSSTKFPRVASKYSPSFSIIKAISDSENIYHFSAHDMKTGQNIRLSDRYKGQILLIVNLPPKISTEQEIMEMKFLNDLRNRYKHKLSAYGRGFEVLGFFPYKKQSTWRKVPRVLHLRKEEKREEEEEIHILADFPIFIKGDPKDSNDRDFWNFLRKTKEKENQTKQEQEFEKYLVDGEGKCVRNFPWFEFEQLKGSDSEDAKPGVFPGHDVPRPDGFKDPRYELEDAIAGYFKDFKGRDYTN